MFDRMGTRATIAVLSVCMVLALGCPGAHQSEPEPKTGETCSYITLQGTATIVSVKDVTDTAEVRDYGCSDDPESVMFTWQVNDPQHPNLWIYEDAVAAMGWTLGTPRCLRIGHNQYYPPGRWAELEGLTLDSQHACNAEAITGGACTPVLYTFADVNYDTLEYYGCE
jgi:hypothetical protein